MAEEDLINLEFNFFIIKEISKPTCNDVVFKNLQFYKHISGIIQHPVAVYCISPVRLHLAQPEEHTEFDLNFVLPGEIVSIIKENATITELQIRFGKQVDDNTELSEGLPGPLQISINSHKSTAINSPINFNCNDHLYLGRVEIENEKSNRIKILWPPCNEPYYMVVNIVESVTVENMVKRVQFQNELGGMKLNTKAKTMETLKNYKKKSDVLVFNSLKLNLMCPINKLKMILPTRSLKCSSHLQCFDLHTFFSLNKIKPTWKCPVCNIPIRINDLVVDSFLLDIINSSSLPENCFEVIFYANGNWEPYIEPKIEYLDDEQSKSDNEYSENITITDDMDEF